MGTKIVCIVTKVINETHHDSQKRSTPISMDQWTQLRMLIDDWHDAAPRTMLPLLKSAPRPGAQLPNGTVSTSYFPVIYHQTMSASFAAVFFHTVWLILLQHYPFSVSGDQHDWVKSAQYEHAHNIYGIACCAKNR